MNIPDTTYTQWIHHGKTYEPIFDEDDDYDSDDDKDDLNEKHNVDDMQEMLRDIHVGTYMDNLVSDPSNCSGSQVTSGEDFNGFPSHISDDNFARLFKDAQRELYLGCRKYSKLSFHVKALHLKVINH